MHPRRPRKQAALRQERLRRALLDDAPVPEHDDLVGLHQRCDAVRDQNHRRAARRLAQPAADGLVGLRVHGGERVVKHHDRRMLQQRPRDGGSLLLSAGERHAALADHRFIPGLKAADSVVQAGFPRRLLDFIPADVFPGDGDIYKDNADVLIVSPLDDEVSGQRVIPETGGGWSWSALRSINFLLDNLGNCKDQKVRDKYEALARFFRAYFYFEKVKRFGDVPWYDKVLGSDDADLYKARDSREFVMGKIMEDLNFAIEIFKETNRTKELYRVTWWTAQALKSRVGLFEGTYRKYHGLGDYEKYLNDCVSASNEIMTASGGYSLYQSGSQSYRNLFKSENAIDAEIILARDYNNDLSLVHKVQAFENSPTLGRPGLSKKLVNYYLMKNGNRFTDQPNYATMEFKDEIVNRDPRLAQTIRTSNINMNVTMTGYHLLKYANDNMSYTGDSSNDLPLFRLAEVYLNYAEAKAELGTLTQTDIDNTVNKLRTRAGVTGKLNMNAANLAPDPYMCAPETGYVNVTGDNKGVILEIRRERAIELVMEGFRYYDLMRWKERQCMAQSFKGFYLPATAINKAYDIDGDGTNDVCFYTTSSQPNVGSVTYVKLASDGSGTSLSEGNYGNLLCYSWIDRTWNENRDYLYPIPRQEITLSNGVVTQNPGWNE